MKNTNILSFTDVAKADSNDNNEALVDVRTYNASIRAVYEKSDMIPYTGNSIFVRDTLAKKLAVIETEFSRIGYSMQVVYGYRHPEIQEKYFEKRKQILRLKNPTASEIELDELTHRFVAVPSVAGHPTGGAVDVTLVKTDGAFVDMGTKIADFSDVEKIETFAKDLTPTQVENRRILRDAMIKEELAPFYGEWWHFSYGDREWATFYGKSSSLYAPIDFKR
ncbi:MAG: D-alanyl-D-alanine carboxypeptidase family protein [Patescibacteria group bacterium]|nr:D-alanyl-D-alanine carboxypeptidase family protein [Patescibacteria group bacterium]